MRVPLQTPSRIPIVLPMIFHPTGFLGLGLAFSLTMSETSGLRRICGVSVYLFASAAWRIGLRLSGLPPRTSSDEFREGRDDLSITFRNTLLCFFGEACGSLIDFDEGSFADG